MLIEFYYVFEDEQQTEESDYTAENYLLVLNGNVDEIVIDYGAFFIVSLRILLMYKIVSSLITCINLFQMQYYNFLIFIFIKLLKLVYKQILKKCHKHKYLWDY